MTNWFHKLVGFEEKSPEQVRQNLILKNGMLFSKINGAKYEIGELEISTLNQLKFRSNPVNSQKNIIREVTGDIQHLHTYPENNGALIQVASQFNLLEMHSPDITPEHGIAIYEFDKTQGPVCAIACGAGTIYRNYFIDVNGKIGQSAEVQVDCLSDIGNYFKNSEKKLWKMQNGYASANEAGLEEITNHLNNLNDEEYEYLKGLLKVGIQKDTDVTIIDKPQKVTQVYCSALPVGYSSINPTKWQEFAKLILDGLYESTILSAIENKNRTQNNKVYLTLVGGGVFGNDPEWLIEAIVKNLKKYEYNGLDIVFVSHLRPNDTVKKIIDIMSDN